MEEQRLAQAKAGDRAAQGELVKEFYGYVMGYLIKLTLNRQLAEDLTQETFIKALRALPGWRGESGLGSWLIAIAHNAYRDHLRSRRNAASISLEDLPLSDEGQGAEAMAQAAEAREALEKLAALPPDRRELIVLRYYYGYSSKEIGKMLGVAEGTVRSRLHYALKAVAGGKGEEV